MAELLLSLEIRKAISQISRYFSRRIELVAILLIFLAWYSTNLEGGLSIDESIYASVGESIMHGHPYVNLEHPPLAKYIIGLGEVVLGQNSVGARAFSVLAAIATLLIVYESILIMTSDRRLATASSIILGTTTQFSSYAVMFMLDIYLTIFSALLLYLCIRLFQSDRVDDNRLLLYIGAASACAFASKYYGIYFVIIIYILLSY